MSAAAGKQYELLFQLGAALGSNFNSTFKQAINAQKQLQDSTKKVNDTQKKIDGYQKASNAIAQQQEKMAKLKQEHSDISQKIQMHQRNADQLRAKIEQTGDASGELTAQLVKEENEIEKNTDKLKRNETQMKQCESRINSEQQKLNSLSNELQEAGVNTENLTEENAKLKESYDKLKSTQDRIAEIGAKQAEVKQKIADTKGELLATTAKVAAMGTAFYMGPVKGAMEFETAMQKVSTIADTTKVPLDKLSADVTKLSKETGISAELIAEDVYNAISAGQKTEDAVGFVETSAKLAKAGFAESAQSLDILTTILNAYGMSADKATTVSDMLIQTQNKGKVTVGELSSVMGKIIPTAKSNNVALEQITAGYSIMTAKGIAAAETTTYMNSMLNELGKSGTGADKALRAAAGAGFKDLMANGASLADVLNILQEDAEKSGKSLSDVFGSAEAGKAAVTLLSDGVDGFNDSVQGMIDSTNATQSAFEKVENSAEARMEKAKNSIKILSMTIGQQFLPMVGKAAEKVTEWVNKASDFAAKNPKVVKTLVTAAGALMGLKVAGLGAKLGFLELKSGILTVTGAIQKFKALKMTGSFGKIGAKIGGIISKIGPVPIIVAAIAAAAAAAIIYISTHLEEVRSKIKEVFGDDALATFDKIWAAIQQIGQSFVQLGQQIAPLIGDFVQSILPILIELVMQVGSIIAEFVATVLPILAQILAQVVPLIGQIAQAILPALASIIQALLPVISQVITTILPMVAQTITMVINAIMPLINMILPMLSGLITALTPVIQAVANAISGNLTAAFTAIGGVIQGAITAFQGIINFITGVFTGNWRQAWEGVKQIFSGVFNAIKSIATGVLDGIKNTLSSIGSAISGAASGLKNLVTGGGGKTPGHAKGSSDTEDSFIAGEKGPELITGQPHKVVYTADETKNLFAAQQAAKAAMDAKPAATVATPAANAPTVTPSGSSTKNNITVTQTNQITINGDKPDNLEEILSRNNEKLLQQVDEKLGGDSDERRTRYE